jgi:hypothetical protein
MADEQEQELDLPDPVEPIPVIRHHLHEALLVLADAHTKSQAEDLIEAFRNSSPTSKESALSRRLGRSVQMLAGYLGLLDEEPEDDDGMELEGAR